MGTFRIEIQAVGGHGCQRDAKDGEVVVGCKSPNCPDCLAREFVTRLQTAGCYFDTVSKIDDPNAQSYARLRHWPGQPGEVRDDLLTGIRSGSF